MFFELLVMMAMMKMKMMMMKMKMIEILIVRLSGERRTVLWSDDQFTSPWLFLAQFEFALW